MPDSRPEDSGTKDADHSSVPEESTEAEDQIPAELEAALQQLPEELRSGLRAFFDVSISHSSSFRGPLPHPSHLAGYEKVVPGLADRIIAMAEKQSAHRQSMESKALHSEIDDRKADRTERRTGQFLGFGIGTIAIVSGAIVAVMKQPWVGGFLGGTGVIGLVSVFVYGRKIAAKESAEEA